MIDLASLALALALSQEPDSAPVPADPAPVAPAPTRQRGADDVQRAIAKLASLPAEERSAAMEALARQFGKVDANPVLPQDDVDLERYLALTPPQQAEVMARGFVTELGNGEASRVVARAGLPFMLEGRRIDRADELLAAWSKALRSRRTDLTTLYGIEVLTAAEMEKKYGKPPQRLSGWNLRAPQTLFAVLNLSGHAAVLMLKQVGATWQVVGFHD